MADQTPPVTPPAGDTPPPDPDARKSEFFAMLDEWADKREANVAKNKTNAPKPKSILDSIFGA